MKNARILVVVGGLITDLTVWFMGTGAVAITASSGKLDDNLGIGLFVFCVATTLVIWAACALAFHYLPSERKGGGDGS